MRIALGSFALLICGCSPPPRTLSKPQPDSSPSQPAAANTAPASTAISPAVADTATAIVSAVAQDTPLARRAVLFDSFHAHNFLDRGLIPGEHTYHRLTGLRRAAKLLTDRQLEVRELIVGPITSDKLHDVQLIVLNLPSMDRPPWLTSEIEAVERFIRDGGGMIFITDHTNCYYHQYHLLPLWMRLGLTPTFETACERTTQNLLSRSGSGWLLVRDFAKHPVTEGIRFFGTQTGGRVVGEGVIARTSDNAWADAGLSPLYGEGNPGLIGDMQFSTSEEEGAQGIILAKAIDRGRVVVISDQNSMGDAQISYADNWHLWLNACNWAGRLDINTHSLIIDQATLDQTTLDKIAALPSNTVPDTLSPASAALDQTPFDQTPFDQLVGNEPDRNASPALPAGSWQVECWEDLSGGNFAWGSTDPEKYYYFWCWLNRWCWASAHETASNPAPAGRPLLIACDNHVPLAAAQQRIHAVLQLQGKVVLLGSSSADQSNGYKPSVQPAMSDSDRTAWLTAQLTRLGLDAAGEHVAAEATWHKEPLTHAQLELEGGVIVVIPEPHRLTNANFTPPETSPDVRHSKWQRQLYHWLFEQP